MNYILQLSTTVKDILLFPFQMKHIPLSSTLNSLFTNVNSITKFKPKCSEEKNDSSKQNEKSSFESESPLKLPFEKTQRKLSESTLDTSTSATSGIDSSSANEEIQNVDVPPKKQERMLEYTKGIFTLRLNFNSKLFILKFTSVILYFDSAERI